MRCIIFPDSHSLAPSFSQLGNGVYMDKASSAGVYNAVAIQTLETEEKKTGGNPDLCWSERRHALLGGLRQPYRPSPRTVTAARCASCCCSLGRRSGGCGGVHPPCRADCTLQREFVLEQLPTGSRQ